MIKRFIYDVSHFFEYFNYSSITVLRSEVAYSYLNWLWWLLDPLLMMCVYTFISKYIFINRPEDYPLFVMIGLSIWNYFNKSVMTSVTIISSNRSLLSKVYVPKFILVMVRNQVSFIKMLFSFLIIFGMLLFYQIPISLEWLALIPVMAVLQIVTFGICCICTHIGVFVHDLSNVITVLLRVVMYLSGVFYSVADVIPSPINKIILYTNPVALCIQFSRDIIEKQFIQNVTALSIWLLIGILLSAIGVFLIYKYENTYIKVL